MVVNFVVVLAEICMGRVHKLRDIYMSRWIRFELSPNFLGKPHKTAVNYEQNVCVCR